MRTDWKDRLNNWAPEPPAEAWDKLAAALPEAPPAFAQKLHNHTAPPPPAVWETIADQLDKSTPAATPVIQMFPRNKWLRIGSVAASILVAIFFLQPYLQSEKQHIPNQQSSTSRQSIIPIPIIEGQKAEQSPLEPAPSDIEPVQQARARDYIAAAPLPKRSSEPMPVITHQSSTPARIAQVTSAPAPHLATGIADRYIVLPTAEDAAVRLPKKLYAVYRCEEQPNTPACLERLAALRRQIAAPSLMATSDFTGLLEVVRKMND